MKRFKFYLIMFASTLMLTGCARGCEKVERKYRIGDSNLIVRQYSGGKIIFERHFRGIVNSSETSDGYYFTIGDTTFELSGDVQIIEVR